MIFSGDYTDLKILPKIGDVTRGVSQRSSYIGDYKGEKVMVKKCRYPQFQVLADELKTFFCLRKMGVSYGKNLLFIKMSEVKGALSELTGWDNDANIISQLVDITVFDYFVKPHDRTIGNILLTEDNKLIPIDEVNCFCYDEDIKNKLKTEPLWTNLSSIYKARKKDVIDHLTTLIATHTDQVNNLFFRYGFLRQKIKMDGLLYKVTVDNMLTGITDLDKYYE